MFKLMHKKLNKKGFTLAEMLIVVAIIAILVAIAIPIFMNSLARAEKAVEQANVRSVKAAAINYILDNWDTVGYTGTGADKKVAACWTAEADVKGGDIVGCKVTAHTSKWDKTEVTRAPSATGDGYDYHIFVTIKNTDVSADS